MKIFLSRYRNTLVPLYFFFLFFVIGVVVHRDYGVSGDEAAVRSFGNDAFAYLFQNGPLPAQLDWSFYNPIIHVFMRAMEYASGLTDGGDIWFLRHLMTFGMFFLSIVAFYRIARYRFNDWKLPLLGSLMFMLSPRLFAHGFYNPKDVPAMLFFTLSTWTLLRFLDKKTLLRLFLHILCTAILISMRVFGFLMPVLALLFLWMQEWSHREKMKMSAIYLPTLTLTLTLIWPLLWHHPIQGLIGAFLNTTARSGGGLYFGQLMSDAGTPWHYVLVWIGITTPILYSLFFIIGFIGLWIRCSQRPLCLFQEHATAGLALFWFTIPIAALIALRIGIFDEWRHVLFLYPAFLLISLEGMWWLLIATKKLPALGKKVGQVAVIGFIGLQLLLTGIWTIRNHPYEYAYFSIPTRFVAGQFELDYWGLSYRSGLEWVVRNDFGKRINVFTAARIGKTSADTLPIEQWNRLYFTQAAEADYILDNFRAHEYRHIFPEDRKVGSVIVDGLELLAIYRGPDAEGVYEPIVW